MITSVVIKGECKIEIDNNDKFMYQDKKIFIKDVPFVRYRFRKYTDCSIKYINNMKSVFKYSTHMVEVEVKEGIKDELDKLSSVENLIIFMYVNIDNNVIENGLSEDTIQNIKSCRDVMIDRVMIKDNSTLLNPISANKIREQIGAILRVEPLEIGICSSPLSFNGDACLTAVRARQLMSMYSEIDEVALPSANHECMNTCGCIKYIIIDDDILEINGSKAISNIITINRDTHKTKINKKILPRFRV